MPIPSSLRAPAPAPEPGPTPLRTRPPKPRPEKSRSAWWWGAAVVLVAVAAVAWWQRHVFAPSAAKGAAGPGFRTVAARAGSLEKGVRVTGVTAAENFAVLRAPRIRGRRSGRSGMEFNLTLHRLAPAGAFVRAGDEVAEFDRQYMLLRLDDYRASVEQHLRNVTRLKANLAVTRAAHAQLVVRARGEMEKAELDLKKIPILSDNDAERYRLNHEEAVRNYEEVRSRTTYVDISEGAAVRRAELHYKESELEYARAQRHVDQLLVRAPIDGMVVMLTLRRSGERAQIREGDQIGSGQPYMHIVDTRSMFVDASINQVDAQHVRLGMEARVGFDAYPELELPARVIGVGAFANQTGWRGSYVRSVPIRLKLERSDPRVIPDLSVSADLVLQKAEDAVIVPREAVFSSGDEQFALVREDPGSWRKRPLEVLLENHVETAVASGVAAGDILAAELPGDHAEAMTN